MRTSIELHQKVSELADEHARIMAKMNSVKLAGDDWQAMLRECQRITSIMEGINYASIDSYEITLKF